MGSAHGWLGMAHPVGPIGYYCMGSVTSFLARSVGVVGNEGV